MSFRTSLGRKAVLFGVYLGYAAVAEAFFTTPARIGPGWIGSWRTVWNAGVGARRGRQAEDGPIDPKYPLKETPSAAYLQRTEWNVRDSDVTVLFSIGPTLTGGSLKTVEFARKHRKPHRDLCAGDNTAGDKLKAFFEEHRVKILNVAGPLASKELGEFAMSSLGKAFTDIGG